MNYPKRIWLNGKLADPRKPLVSAFDRGFLYGDGVYETVRVYGGKMFHFDAHFARLEGSARGVSIPIPYSRGQVRAAADATLAANGLKEANVRFTLTRGESPLGFDPTPCHRSTLLITAVPVTAHAPVHYEKGIRLAIAKVRRNAKTSLDPAMKTTNNINNILAKMESLRRNAYEALMLNAEGLLAEGTISNVFFAAGGALKTPSLDCGLLAGVTRSIVIGLAKARRIPVVEGRFRPRDLFGAKEVFITSTTLEVMPVTRVVDEDGAEHAIGGGKVGPMAPMLRAEYRRLVVKELGVRLP